MNSSRGNHGSEKKKKKKCVTGLWDLHLPSDLLQEILSRLVRKANIQASVVCKAWFETAVSVRKFQPPPWLFYPSSQDNGDYILFDPSKSQIHKKNVPDLKGHVALSGSRDGWLLVVTKNKPSSKRGFFLNPFTRERIYLPNSSLFFKCLAFSAAPTSTSCLVVSFLQTRHNFKIATWTPGETQWTIHRYPNTPPYSTRGLKKCVFSNGLFYALNDCGFLGVFDPCKATWDGLPVKQWLCPSFYDMLFDEKALMMEHDGNIFVMSTCRNNNNNKNWSVFKLNREQMEWEEKSEVCGLTVFASYPASLTGSRSYPSTNELLRVYYSLLDDKSSLPPYKHLFI